MKIPHAHNKIYLVFYLNINLFKLNINLFKLNINLLYLNWNNKFILLRVQGIFLQRFAPHNFSSNIINCYKILLPNKW